MSEYPKHYRLLKDTPEANAGLIVTRENDYNDYDFEDKFGNEAIFMSDIVENQPEWFEQVASIYVKPLNAETLQQLDSMTGPDEKLGTPRLKKTENDQYQWVSTAARSLI